MILLLTAVRVGDALQLIVVVIRIRPLVAIAVDDARDIAEGIVAIGLDCATAT